MYNEEYKKQYVDQLSVKTAVNEFNRIAEKSEDFESKFGKDLHDFSDEETIELLNSFCLTSPLSLKQYASCISKYQSWGLSKNIVRKPISKYDIDFVSAYKKSYYTSFSDLKSDLQSVIELDQGYSSVVALCFAWLGIQPADVGKVSKSDIDLKNGTLSYKDMDKIKIDSEILQILRSYANLTVAYRTQGQTFEVYPLPSEYFLTRMATKNSRKTSREVTIQDISQEISIISEKVNSKFGKEAHITYQNIQRSGEFYRLHQAEISGLNVFSKEYESEVQNFFSAKIPYYEITFMYKKYKQAFDL